MSFTKKITKSDLLEIAKKSKADKNYIFSIENLPNDIVVDDANYKLALNGVFNDKQNIIGIEINYFNSDNFKHLFNYKKYDNMYDALSESHVKINKFIAK